MSTQTTIEDILDSVAGNADHTWKAAVEMYVRRLARTRGEFTSDDVQALLDQADLFTHEPNALGAMMHKLARANVIVATDRFVKSQRPSAHSRRIAVWRAAA